MAHRSILDLDLHPALSQLLRTHNLTTARDVLLLSSLDLMELLGLTEFQAMELTLAVSAHITPPFQTAQQLSLEFPHPLSQLHTSLPSIDEAFQRGLPLGGITELVGPSGVGKSQFCFMMTVMASAPTQTGGLGGTTVYIDTEKKLSVTRLVEIARSRFAGSLSSDGVKELLGRVVIFKPDNTEELVKCLNNIERYIAVHGAKLVVIDSIAALPRLDYGGRDGAVERAEVLGQVAVQLKSLAESFRLPVLVVNQVTTAIRPTVTEHRFQQQQALQALQAEGRQRQQQEGNHESSTPAPSARNGAPQDGGGGGSNLVAALGTKWAHCVNVRLVLERIAGQRYLKVAKSPSSPHIVIEYAITPRGLEEVQHEGGPRVAQQSVLGLPLANEMDYFQG
ncbi:MAG: hypothetical protein WDW38_009953 [Sanguina aurantia]